MMKGSNMNQTTKIQQLIDYDAIKSKQNAAWSSGDYGRIGITLQITGEELAESLNLAPQSKTLDVAAGNGNATLAFARRWCDVTSTDYVDTLLKQGQSRAAAEGLENIAFQIADAEDLPYVDGEFDAVVSTFGVMFAPNQSQAAKELARVTKSGGKIGLVNWTADGFIGQLFKLLGNYVVPPAGVQSPARWGDQEWLEEAFEGNANNIELNHKDFIFRYPSPAFFVDFFRTYYGPVHKAFLALDEQGQKKLEADFLDLITRFNTATDGTMRVPSQYSEIIITKS